MYKTHTHNFVCPITNMIYQDQIRLLMEGRPYEELHEFCDFSIAEQNEAAASKGVQPGTPSDFVPVVKKSVCYIVAAVIFNENSEVSFICFCWCQHFVLIDLLL